jgi:hypothetical protein
LTLIFDNEQKIFLTMTILQSTSLRVARAASVHLTAGRSVGLASTTFRAVIRSWASTLVVMDEGEEEATDRSSSTNSTPETTRRVVSAAMQLRVADTGKDSEIHLLVIDPERVPSRIPIGVTKVLHWKNHGGAKAEQAASAASTAAAAAAQAMEHAFVRQSDATHLLATFGRKGGDALALVAKGLNAPLHDNVVEIKGRGTPRGERCR